MLAGIDRDQVLCKIHAVLQAPLVDRGEAVAQEGGVLVRDIQIKVGAAGALLLQHDGAADHVARGKLQPVVIAVHEALPVAVEQIRPLAAHGFADQKLLAVLRMEGGGMELDPGQILYERAELPREAHAVAGGRPGIGGIAIDPPDAAGGQQHEGRIDREHAAADVHQRAEAPARHFLQGQDRRVFNEGDVFAPPNLLGQRAHQLRARAVPVVDDAAAAMAALQRFVELAVGVAVKVRAEVHDPAHVVRALPDQRFHRQTVVCLPPGDHGVADVQLEGVVLERKHRRHAPLREIGGGHVQRVFCQQQHAPVGRQIQRAVHPGDARPDDQYVIILLEFHVDCLFC